MNIIEMAMAAKMSGGNGGGGGGTGASSWNAVTGKPFDENNIIKPEALPEGYPYKEGSKTVIEWDGNTAGHEEATISTEIGFTMWCISGSVPTVEELQSAELEALYGGEVMSGKVPDLGGVVEIGSVYAVADGMAIIAKEPVVFEHENGFTITFPKAGVYSMLSEGTYVKKLSYGNETIHTMSEEFMPLLTSPNGTKYKLTVSDDGALSAVQV